MSVTIFDFLTMVLKSIRGPQQSNAENRPTTVKLLGVLSFFLALAACSGVVGVESWTLMGTVTITDTNLSPTDVVRLGAFFTPNASEEDVLDSFVAEHTLVSTTPDVTGGGAFSLYVDPGGVSPNVLDKIWLIFWIDENDDGGYDASERWSWTEADEEDAVLGNRHFGDASSCGFEYHKFSLSPFLPTANTGWLVLGKGARPPRTEDTLEGTSIENQSTFSS